MKMTEEKPLNHCKQPRNNEANERRSKKRKTETNSRKEIICSDVQTIKKAPRLSPALFRDNCEIYLTQIHELLKYASLGKCGQAAQPSWCHIYHQRHLRGVVIVVLQDLGQLHFYRFYSHFRALRKRLPHRFSLPPPSPLPACDFLATLVGIEQNRVGDREGEELMSEHPLKSRQGSSDLGHSSEKTNHRLTQDPIVQKYEHKKHGLTRYLLSEKAMRKNEYPLVGSQDGGNFVHTGCDAEAKDNSPLFGLDCEMCLTDKGKELTQISLVDARGQCIMDELVKPDNPIRDYLTRFSGITETLLLPVKTKLKDVQDKLKTLLPPDAVLVGHSLNNDLWALQMTHRNIIDTAVLYARGSARKFKLKFLTQAVLGREIQREDVTGHNPSEDAKAALNLAQYFIHQGPEKVGRMHLQKVLRSMNNLNDSLTVQENTPVLKQNGHIHPLNTTSKTSALAQPQSLAESLDSVGQKILYVGRMDDLKHTIPSEPFENILCTSNEEASVILFHNIIHVLQKACTLVPLSPVSVVQFLPERIHTNCIEDMNEKMRTKFAEMMTVFAGPFKKDFCLTSVQSVFKTCGPIHSLSIVADTYQPYIRVQYSVLEAAQLSVEVLSGTCVDGSCIKVQRLMNERTLDCEEMLKEMEEDLENKGIMYVSGFKKSLTEEVLQQRFSHFKDIKAIFVPTNHRNRKHTKYCYLKFHSSQSALVAAQDIRAQGELKCRKALTASHLHHWLQTAVTSVPPGHQPSQETLPKEEDITDTIRNMDRKIKTLFESLQGNTLCMVLFPGKNRFEVLLT
ncbi:hypothetical protein FKM82_002816 [Ascaphus truei]